MPAPLSFHPGELAAQERRGYADDVWGMYENIDSGLSIAMAQFFSQLEFLSVTTLDEMNRPWGSILVSQEGKKGFITASLQRENGGKGEIEIDCKIVKGDPIRETLQRLAKNIHKDGMSPFEEDGSTPKRSFLIAAVGVMLHNRRRNKLEGVIVKVPIAPTQEEEEDRFVFVFQIESTFGNCPKYINTRKLVPALPNPTAKPSNTSLFTVKKEEKIPQEVLSILTSADLVFLCTRHLGSSDTYPPDPPRVGNNCRGGRPGFLRHFWDEHKARHCIVLPDWSGNRILQSLGNITSDHVSGLTIPIWGKDAKGADSNETQTGSTLHLTCEAEVLSKDEAKAILRGVDGATTMWITGWSLVSNNLTLASAKRNVTEIGQGGTFESLQSQMTGGAGGSAYMDRRAESLQENDKGRELFVGWSPYNPPNRLLASESSLKPYLSTSVHADVPLATLVDVSYHSSTVATFFWKVMNVPEIQYKPGQHVTLDLYDALDTRVQMYSHMSYFKGGEKDLNDDGVRSWTISYAQPHADEDGNWQFEVTLRRKERGGVTPGLFARSAMMKEEMVKNGELPHWTIKGPLLGLDGDALLPLATSTRNGKLKLTYLMSGIGLTPILPHLTELQRRGQAARVLAIIGCRHDEARLVEQLVSRALSRVDFGSQRPKVEVKLHLLLSSTPKNGHMDKGSHKDEHIERSKGASASIDVKHYRSHRLTSNSFLALSDKTLSRDDGLGFTSYETFHLQDNIELQHIKDSDQIIICASTSFSKAAKMASTQLGVDSSKIHAEDFGF